MIRIVLPALVALVVFAVVMLLAGTGRQRRTRQLRQAASRSAQLSAAAPPAPHAEDAWLPVERSPHGSAVRLTSGAVRVELRANPERADDVAVFVDDRMIGRLPDRVAPTYLDRLATHGGRLGAMGLVSDGALWLVPVGLTQPSAPRYLNPMPAWGWTTTPVSLEKSFVHPPGVAQVFEAAERPITENTATLDDVLAVLIGSGQGFVDALAGDAWLGSLGASDAEVMGSALDRLARNGGVLQVPARLAARRVAGRLSCRVTLRLPEPDDIEPPGALPDAPFVVLPALTTLQVQDEPDAAGVLAPLLGGRAQALAVVTLHSGAATARGVSRVEVRVDGRPVGRLGTAASAATLGLIQACEQAGRVPVARGLLRGNSLDVSLAVRTARTADVTDEWLARELGD